MDLYNSIVQGKEKISVIGLGYVGLPLAIAFAKVANVIAYDISSTKIAQYINCNDITQEVGNDELRHTSAYFTDDDSDLACCSFHIIAVPTPINNDKTPDLQPVIAATKTVAKHLRPGSIVVYESTVYPGVTEDICGPLLASLSGLTLGEDFTIGYSPERINPGDKIHRLDSIVKVVSGLDKATLSIISAVYQLIISAGVFKATSIKVAEAAKAIENAQRDVNIAFMNEMSKIFNRMNIDTLEVLEAAKTKWNFLDFRPGLVGGHCIGIDPYYLTYRAEELGYHPQVILAGRSINDNMGNYIARETIKLLIHKKRDILKARVGVLGITFKENCPDVRNTRVLDILHELKAHCITTVVVDPVADLDELKSYYSEDLSDLENLHDLDALIVAVAHDKFKMLNLNKVKNFYKDDVDTPILIDVKGIYSRHLSSLLNYEHWRL